MEDLSTTSQISQYDSTNQPELNDVTKYLNLEESDFNPKLEESFEIKNDDFFSNKPEFLTPIPTQE